jgi:hypothetical protein
VIFQVEFLCVMTPRNVVGGYQGFGGPCYPHLQGEEEGEVKSPLERSFPTKHYTASQPRRPFLG